MRKNYELIKKITPHMLNNQEPYCLHHSQIDNAVDRKIVVTNRENTLRIGYFFMVVENGLIYDGNNPTPVYDFHILVDETKELARVKTVYGENYQYFDNPVSKVPAIKTIDEQDKIADGFIAIYETLVYSESNDEYICDFDPDTKYREIDVNCDLARCLNEILKELGEQGEDFFHKYTLQATASNKITEPLFVAYNRKILHIQREKVEFNYYECKCDNASECLCERSNVNEYLCECVICGKLTVMSMLEMEHSSKCEHDNFFLYFEE